MASRCYSHGKQETDEEFDARWVTYFNKPDIDAWELRKGTFIDDSKIQFLKFIVKFKLRLNAYHPKIIAVLLRLACNYM